MTTASDHVNAAMEHLAGAAEAETGSATEHYHLSVASTQAALASVVTGQQQADAIREAAQINGRLLALMVQGEPEAVAAITADIEASR